MPAVTQFLGVDVGTTTTKVACYDSTSRRLVALRRAPTARLADAWGGARDAELVVAEVSRLLAGLVQDEGVWAGEIGGVAVASVGEEVVLLDDAWRARGTVLCWHARHGEEALRQLRRLSPAQTPASSHEVDPTLSLYKLAWLARNRSPDVADASAWTSLADFVALSLTGRRVESVFLNASHASRTGLLDVVSGRLGPGPLHELGMSGPPLPTLVPSGSPVGCTPRDGPLPAEVPVVAGGHDHFCGAFGAGVRTAGELYVSAGTSEAQVVLVDALPDAVPSGFGAGLFVAGSLRYLFRATPSGQLFGRWREMLYRGESEETLWEEVERAGPDVEPASIDPRTGTHTLPALRVDASRGDVMVALLKGLAVEADRTTDRLEELTSTTVDSVTVAGVPTTSRTWRRLRQQASARPLRFVAEPEATVLGVALLAQHGVTGAADRPATFLTENRTAPG